MLKGVQYYLFSQTVVICLLLLSPFQIETSFPHLSVQFARAEVLNAVPSGWESYSSRPNILELTAKQTPKEESWEALKGAHFDFIANLLEFYPDQELEFLARDSEYLYDVAKLVTKGTKDEKRIHLLNISRANMVDPNLHNYLEQNGISTAKLKAGKKYVFVDTGFLGTIPRSISPFFPKEFQSQLRTQLIVSGTQLFPSSRSFLIHLNPGVNGIAPPALHTTILNYEELPRYTDRSSKYINFKGSYQPISEVSSATNGEVSKSKSLELMQDLVAQWNQPSTKERFKFIRNEARALLTRLPSLQKNSKNYIRTIQEIHSYLGGLEPSERKKFEAMIRDALDVFKSEVLSPTLILADLGLRVEYSGIRFNSRDEIIDHNPEWGSIFEKPESKIPELFKANKWQIIGSLLDTQIDREIQEVLLKNLFDAPATGVKRDLQKAVLDEANFTNFAILFEKVFSKEKSLPMFDDLKTIIEKADSRQMMIILEEVFSKPFSWQRRDLLRLTIERGADEGSVMRYAAHFVFSNPGSELDMEDVIISILKNTNDFSVLKSFARDVFSRPHGAKMLNALRTLVSLAADIPWLGEVVQEAVFKQPYANTPAHVALNKALLMKDKRQRNAYLKNLILQPDASAVLKKASAPQCRSLF